MYINSIHTKARAGFTLVELAIVLVIVGLLVGGVLVAQTLIETAGMRATGAQMESYNVAAVTFRARNHGLPGDLIAQRALSFGLAARSGGAGRGDGNALLQNGSNPLALNGLGHETALFWRDLWDADLIQTPLTNATDAPAASIITANLPLWLPPAKIRSTAYFHTYGFSGRHYFYIGGLGAAPTDANGILSLAPGLIPTDAMYLDEKFDDGIGNRGSIIATQNITTHAIDVGTGAAGECLTASFAYNVDGSDARTIACSISVRSEF